MRVAGCISPAQAAKRLGVDRRTISNWANRYLEGRDSRLRGVQRTMGGYLLIPTYEVDRILREHDAR